MGFKPVKLGPVERPVVEPDRGHALHLTPSPSPKPLDQMFRNSDRPSGADSLRVPDSADDREVHRALLLERFARLVKCRRIQTDEASATLRGGLPGRRPASFLPPLPARPLPPQA